MNTTISKGRTMSKSAKYNGWANYETWNVALWFGNDEGLYRAMRSFVRSHEGRLTGADVQYFVMHELPEGTPDFDSPDDYKRVRWAEIARAWKDEK